MKYGECVHKKRTLAGYFTVEMSLLMALILPLLISIIIMSFYLHDRAGMQGVVCEMAAMASNRREYQGQEADIQEQMNSRLSSVAIRSRNVAGSAASSEKQVSISCSGTFLFPQLMSVFGKSGDWVIEKAWNRKLYKPAGLIRKVRGIKGLADTLHSNQNRSS